VNYVDPTIASSFSIDSYALMFLGEKPQSHMHADLHPTNEPLDLGDSFLGIVDVFGLVWS